MKFTSLIIFLLFAVSAIAQIVQPVPTGFPSKVPATLAEAQEEAYARSRTYTRNISTMPMAPGSITVYSPNQSGPYITLPVGQPGTYESIVTATMADNPYFKVADDRMYIQIWRTINDEFDLPMFQSWTSFQLERLPSPIGQMTHKLPYHAVNIVYDIGPWTVIEIPEMGEAQFTIFNEDRPWDNHTQKLQVIERNGRYLVLFENWMYGLDSASEGLLSIQTNRGASVHYDFGNNGKVSSRGNYPLSITPQTVRMSRTQVLRFNYTPSVIEIEDQLVWRYGDNGEWVDNPLYDIMVKNLPSNTTQYLTLRIVAISERFGDARPLKVKVRARDAAGNIVKEYEVAPDQNGRIVVPVQSGQSSVRAWATEWPEPIQDTGYGRG